MKRIKLRESNLKRIIQRIINENESQLLTEEAPCKPMKSDECNGCIAGVKGMGGNHRDVNCVCFDQLCGGERETAPCTDKEIEAGCHEGVSGDCVCDDVPDDRPDRPGLSERAYRRKLRYRR